MNKVKRKNRADALISDWFDAVWSYRRDVDAAIDCNWDSPTIQARIKTKALELHQLDEDIDSLKSKDRGN